MSWWTDNRHLLGLLGLAATGVGAPLFSTLAGASKAASPILGLLQGNRPQAQMPTTQPAAAGGPMPQPEPMKPLYGPMAGGDQLPPELAQLPPDHPAVLEWKKQRGLA